MMKEFTNYQDDDYLTLFLWTDICLEIKTKLEIVYASAVVLAIWVFFYLERGGGYFFI